MSDWQLIETAPRDGQSLLLRVPTLFGKWNKYIPCCGAWFEKYWIIFNADEAIQMVEPTHWMPLPPPPK